MAETQEKQEDRGDEILRRMLQTPPDPKKTPLKQGNDKAPANTTGASRGDVKPFRIMVATTIVGP